MHRTAPAWQFGFFLAALLSVSPARATGGSTPLLQAKTPVSAPRPAGDTTVFTGVIRDAETGRPLEGAVLQVQSNSAAGALSDAQGHYSFKVAGIPVNAPVVVRARRIGYRSATKSVLVQSDTVRADFSMSASQNLETMVVAAAVVPLVQRGQVSSRSTVAPVSRTRTGSPLRDSSAVRKAGNREQYDRIEDNPFLAVKGNPRSTFSVDVDRASYGNVRRMLTAGMVPPADAVRIEELVNYFPYSLAAPGGNAPVAISTEAAPAPWQPKHRLVRIALKARDIETAKLPPSNLVFLVDVSGSMNSPDKLPLVKESLRLLVEQLREQDRVAIVVYAGAAGLALPSTSGADKSRIAAAIDALEAGGSTAGGAGITLAYKVAGENFNPAGNNRVVLATDGDFNVGASSDGEMERLIEEKRLEGTYLTVLGFGTGNYQDAKMEKLAKKGNGNYAYVDRISEARKALVHEMGATLVTVANDVKLRVEFNPAAVRAYRLIGYEDRLLRDEDFADDRKDAGDMGAGHTVTAFYEIVPVGVSGTVNIRESDALRYTSTEPPALSEASPARGGELAYVKLRYKVPGDSTSKLLTHIVRVSDIRSKTSDDFRFAASVAAFGMVLRDSEHKGTATGASVLKMARTAIGRDAGGYRAEFVGLVERWQDIGKVAVQR